MTRKEIKALLFVVLPCALLCTAGTYLMRSDDYMSAQVVTIAPNQSVLLTSVSNSTFTLAYTDTTKGSALWPQQIVSRNQECFLNESGQDTGKVYLSTVTLASADTAKYGWPITGHATNYAAQERCFDWGGGIPIYGLVPAGADTQKLRVLITK